MNKISPFFYFLGFLLLCSRHNYAGELKQLESVRLTGKIAQSKDISALDIVRNYLIIGSDETGRCQVLKSTDDGFTLLPDNDVKLNDTDEEIDIEGITSEGDRVYVMGSHSRVRPKLEEGASLQSNREQIGEIRTPAARDVLACFRLGADGQANSIEKRSLRSVIDRDAMLRPFAQIPGKENGIDLEGIAVKEGRLFIGFRGPVLRSNYVPVFTCEFERVEEGRLLFVNLGGFGVRGMAAVKDGFLIVGGPVGDASQPHKIFFWNGFDCLPGDSGTKEKGIIEVLCEIPFEDHGKPEGFVITKEDDSHYEFLIAFDGIKNGGIKRFLLSKTATSPETDHPSPILPDKKRQKKHKKESQATFRARFSPIA
jgi:hypothetical protein